MPILLSEDEFNLILWSIFRAMHFTLNVEIAIRGWTLFGHKSLATTVLKEIYPRSPCFAPRSQLSTFLLRNSGLTIKRVQSFGLLQTLKFLLVSALGNILIHLCPGKIKFVLLNWFHFYINILGNSMFSDL